MLATQSIYTIFIATRLATHEFHYTVFFILHENLSSCSNWKDVTSNKAVAGGPVGQVWPDHYFSKKKQNSILQKASNEQKY